jgi:hypothetical protein
MKYSRDGSKLTVYSSAVNVRDHRGVGNIVLNGGARRLEQDAPGEWCSLRYCNEPEKCSTRGSKKTNVDDVDVVGGDREREAVSERTISISGSRFGEFETATPIFRRQPLRHTQKGK